MLARLISEMYLSVVASGLRRASAKAWPGASTMRSGPATEASQEILKKFGDPAAPPGIADRLVQQNARLLYNRQQAACGVEAGMQSRETFITHEHDEMGLRQPRRTAWIEHRRAEGDGKAPVLR